MLACVDVAYHARGATAACLLWHDWPEAIEARRVVSELAEVAPYEPGSFYRRELPCILKVLADAASPTDEIEAVVIDGYVWLSADGRPGLGAHLFEALGGRVKVVGVAKTSFRGSEFAEQVLRGGSARPLFVTAAGVEPSVAAGWIRQMAGEHRIPTLLKRVDTLCRQGAVMSVGS